MPLACEDLWVPLVWVTGSSGVGKSTVCGVLKSRGEFAVDADFEGFSHWVDRSSGRVIADPPYPTPSGWLDGFGWRISRAKIESLLRTRQDKTVFVCGGAENEAEVWDLFDLLVCLVASDEALRDRLETRTTNAFGQHPEELEAALGWNQHVEARYRGLGATIVDGTQPPDEVADAILAAATTPSNQVPKLP